MRTPAFWWRSRPTPLAASLAAVGAVYGAATAWRMARPGFDPGLPVLCVGNLVAGGAGKTPTTAALAGLLRDRGFTPAILSRGYGRRSGGAAMLRVDPDRHDWREAGDEPLLLARTASTFVATDRAAAASAAAMAGADVLVLDDGLQSPALRKRWAVAVVDGNSGVGNGLCVPAGPLRAPTSLQWLAVSLLCVIGRGAAGEAVARRAAFAGVPVTTARLVPDADTLDRWRGRPLFAFAGLGLPDKFFRTLEEAGMTLAGRRAFPDHHPYAQGDLAALRDQASGALLVTTAKDRVRLPPDFPAEALPVRLAFADPEAVWSSLRAALSA